MKRFILAATAAFTILTGVLVGGITSPALAHTLDASATCQGGVVYSARYYEPVANTVTVYYDGRLFERHTFGASFDGNVPNPDKTLGHTWSVVVDQFNGTDFDFTRSGSIPACVEPAPTTTAPATTTTIAPTTTTIGAPPSTTTPTTSPATTPSSTSSPPSTIVDDSVAPSAPPTTTTSTVAGGLPPVPPTTEGDATSQGPVPPVPPSGLPKTGLKRDTARLAAGLLLAGFVLVGVRRVRRT